MSNKLNNKQIKVVDELISILNSWKNTNDFNSPTILSDAREQIFDLEVDGMLDSERYNIIDALETIKITIQMI